MRAIFTLVISAVLAARCAAIAPEIKEWAESAGIPVEVIQVGDYSAMEVQGIRDAIAKVEFPAAEGTVAGLLVRPIRAIPTEYGDGLPDREKKGRIGGNVVVYWLSDAFVLRVATAYYVEGEKYLSREEWAVILSPAENANYVRRIY